MAAFPADQVARGFCRFLATWSDGDAAAVKVFLEVGRIWQRTLTYANIDQGAISQGTTF